MGVRLPTILGKGIDDVWKTLNQEYEEERILDLIQCIHRMEDLMGDLHGNSKLRPIIDDGAGDVALWNKVGLFDVPFQCGCSHCRTGDSQILSWQGFHECSVALCRGIQIPPA